MTQVFGDTAHWIALQLEDDPLHDVEAAWIEALPPGSRIVTSNLVLVEFSNYMSGFGPDARMEAAETWHNLHASLRVGLIPVTDDVLREALQLYAKVYDKEWSLRDCSSFVIMRDLKIFDALTEDHHFNQAGFRALFGTDEPK